MPELRIDGWAAPVVQGGTLLSAARALGIHVPTLCFQDGAPRHTSCMVCLVEDLGTHRLVPACATPARAGMDIRTAGRRVAAARLRSAELLMAEHEGDCEAPCARACPVHADIPGVMRLLGRGDAAGARARLSAGLPLAGTLACTCPAPCRRACRRGRLDSPIDICGVKAALMSLGRRGDAAGRASHAPPTGTRVSIVGAGPAGLSAAWFLARLGHDCLVFDERAEPGGMLRAGTSSDILPPGVFDADLALLREAGVDLRMCSRILPGAGWEAIRSSSSAVLLATGSPETRDALIPQGSVFDPATGVVGGSVGAAASGSEAAPGVFVCGNAARETPSRMAARDVEEGRRAARCIGLFLENREILPELRRFDSRRRAVTAAFLVDRAAAATSRARQRMESGCAEVERALAPIAVEAARCLQCDCVRKRSCRLRTLATSLKADSRRFAADRREESGVLAGKNGLTLDQGKCIKCGVCVLMAEAAGARPGLAFRGLGAETRVCVPFGADLGGAAAGIAGELVKCCPTGALAWDF